METEEWLWFITLKLENDYAGTLNGRVVMDKGSQSLDVQRHVIQELIPKYKPEFAGFPIVGWQARIK